MLKFQTRHPHRPSLISLQLDTDQDFDTRLQLDLQKRRSKSPQSALPPSPPPKLSGSKSPARRQHLIQQSGNLFEYLYARQECKNQNLKKIELQLKQEEDYYIQNKPVFVSKKSNQIVEKKLRH